MLERENDGSGPVTECEYEVVGMLLYKFGSRLVDAMGSSLSCLSRLADGWLPESVRAIEAITKAGIAAALCGPKAKGINMRHKFCFAWLQRTTYDTRASPFGF